MKCYLVVPFLLCLVWSSRVTAQGDEAAPWRWSTQLSASLALNDTDWSISHPIYGGGSVEWETLEGAFSQGFHVQGHLEVRKRYFGFRGTLGILPQRFTQDAPAQDKDLNLVLGAVSAVLYPWAHSGRRTEPYVLAGAGAQKATGDMDNTGFFLSFAMGALTTVSGRFSLDVGVQAHRLKYAQVDLGNAISKDLRAFPVSVFVGVRTEW